MTLSTNKGLSHLSILV